MWYICIKPVYMEHNGRPTNEVAFIKDKVYDWRKKKEEAYDTKKGKIRQVFTTTSECGPDHDWYDIHNDSQFKEHFKRYRKPRIREVDPKEFVIGKYL